MASKENGMSYLDLIIQVLQEHEKALDMIADKMQKIVDKLNRTPAAESSINPEETTFIDDIGETLLKLPKGYTFDIPKITHTAHVKITWTESEHHKEAKGKTWEEKIKEWTERVRNDPSQK